MEIRGDRPRETRIFCDVFRPEIAEPRRRVSLSSTLSRRAQRQIMKPTGGTQQVASLFVSRRLRLRLSLLNLCHFDAEMWYTIPRTELLYGTF